MDTQTVTLTAVPVMGAMREKSGQPTNDSEGRSMTKGPRRYVPPTKKKLERTLSCEGYQCRTELIKTFDVWDDEEANDEIMELALRSGWTCNFDILCRECSYKAMR